MSDAHMRTSHQMLDILLFDM